MNTTIQHQSDQNSKMPSAPPDLTVIVITRGRVRLLERAIRTVSIQREVRVAVLVVSDEDAPTTTFLRGHRSPGGAVVSLQRIHASRTPYDASGPRRLAALRQFALSLVKTEWCAFLDDDNELEIDHFRSLLKCAVGVGAPLAHSWRSLWSPEGEPFPLIDRHPWSRDAEQAKAMFSYYCDAGIYTPGSNIVRDQVKTGNRAQSMVDMSEWIFNTDLLREIKFATEYSEEDWTLSRAEDNKLLSEIVLRGIEVPCSQQATLRYYLGGFSNNWSTEASARCGWVDDGVDRPVATVDYVQLNGPDASGL